VKNTIAVFCLVVGLVFGYYEGHTSACSDKVPLESSVLSAGKCPKVGIKIFSRNTSIPVCGDVNNLTRDANAFIKSHVVILIKPVYFTGQIRYIEIWYCLPGEANQTK